MTAHTCHAEGCAVHVPPRLLMCARHWRMVPKRLRDALWAVYVPGQEDRNDPTGEYISALDVASPMWTSGAADSCGDRR